jgi:hypothetical protein
MALDEMGERTMTGLKADIREIRDCTSVAELLHRYRRHADSEEGRKMVTLSAEDCRCDFHAGEQLGKPWKSGF